MNGRVKNMGCIRHCAALAVIFSHSYLIAEGTEENEPVQAMTGEILGIYGVFTFFIISGFLITRSLFNSRSAGHYLWKRFLRVYPGYLVSLLVCIAVVGPLFVTGSVGVDYLAGGGVALGRGMLFIDDFLVVDGVEFYGMPDGTVLNAVYWTIKVEVILYLVILVLKYLKLLNLPVTLVLAVAATCFFVVDRYPGYGLWGLLFGVPGFFAGSFICLLVGKHELRFSGSLIFLVLIVVAAYFGLVHKLFPILAAYPVMYLGYAKNLDLDKYLKRADYSYGMYLFGWPIQQMVRALCGEGLTPCGLFWISVPIIMGVSMVSWRFVERPSLSLKGKAGLFTMRGC